MEKVIEITNRAVADYGFRLAVLYGSEDIARRWDLSEPEAHHESVEHRKNYSMGAGNYLKAGHDDSSGWRAVFGDLTGGQECED